MTSYPQRFHTLPSEAERAVARDRQEFTRMHKDLTLWGEVLLGGAVAKDDPTVIVNDEPLPKVIWHPRDEAKAWAIDRRVNLLDAKNRFGLRVFYRGREAKYWETDYTPEQQRQILIDMCRELNARWREYCASVAQPVTPIGWYEFESIWRSTVRMMAATSEVPFPEQPCG